MLNEVTYVTRVNRLWYSIVYTIDKKRIIFTADMTNRRTFKIFRNFCPLVWKNARRYALDWSSWWTDNSNVSVASNTWKVVMVVVTLSWWRLARHLATVTNNKKQNQKLFMMEMEQPTVSPFNDCYFCIFL